MQKMYNLLFIDFGFVNLRFLYYRQLNKPKPTLRGKLNLSLNRWKKSRCWELKKVKSEMVYFLKNYFLIDFFLNILFSYSESRGRSYGVEGTGASCCKSTTKCCTYINSLIKFNRHQSFVVNVVFFVKTFS